jgi:hypothetical protein
VSGSPDESSGAVDGIGADRVALASSEEGRGPVQGEALTGPRVLCAVQLRTLGRRYACSLRKS